MKSQVSLKWLIVIIGAMLFIAGTTDAQRYVEGLDRGLIAVGSGGGYFLGWRLFGNDPEDIGFNVYRGSTKLNSSPITNVTYYQDNGGGGGDYTIRPVIGGNEQGASRSARVLSNNYLSISCNVPSNHHLNDGSVGDLNGDGEYEIIVKLEADNSKDNSQDGETDVVYLDAYTLDGSRLWSINLGKNIRAGAHYTQFIVYDLDSDGKAEVACKTAPGTKDGTGNYINDGPAASADHNARYINGDGYILGGPEYLTVFDGLTGKELSTVYYKPRRHPDTEDPTGTQLDQVWGDSYGNRVDRFLAGVGYFDGQRPSLLMCRGYYTRTTLVAWDWRNGTLSQRWFFDGDKVSGNYNGQGNHSLSIADLDGDRKDEVSYGSMAVDDDGSPMWTTGFGHGDAGHVSDIDPDNPGQEVWGIHENADVGSALIDGETGNVLWQTGPGDIGRGVSGNVTDSYRGMECWGGTDGLRTCKNQSAGSSPSSSNFLIWWDGDWVRELLDGNHIDKYSGSRLFTADGCSSNNGTKSNPVLSADIFGDWREEVIFRCGNDLRIFTTTTTTDHRLYTLMHDTQYRVAIAWQNVAYNQPPHPSFYIADDMNDPPDPDIVLTSSPVVDCKSSVVSKEHIGIRLAFFNKNFLAVYLDGIRSDVYVNIHSLRGSLIYSGKLTRNGSVWQTKISEELSEGIYLIKIFHSGNVETFYRTSLQNNVSTE